VRSKSNLIFGIHPVSEAITAGKCIDRLLIRQGLRNESMTAVLQLAKQQNIPFQFVPPEKLNRMTRGIHQGIVALVSEIEFTDIEKLVPALFEQGRLPALAILDGITDVRNLGAIARSAEGAGIDALIVPAKGFAGINAEAVKASSGALNTLPVCRTERLDAISNFLHDCGIQLVAASEKATELMYSVDYQVPTAFILGAEDKGINARLLQRADRIVKIPLFGKIQSLNVSVAASVLFYELVRQRKGQ
jgi:23S rRNA (guanosine2251-2'-O)-methyltransferase